MALHPEEQHYLCEHPNLRSSSLLTFFTPLVIPVMFTYTFCNKHLAKQTYEQHLELVMSAYY
jgi:hypothetical protein